MIQDELSSLTPEQKRVKIAEACGWKRRIENIPSGIWAGQYTYWRHSEWESHRTEVRTHEIPDYLSDLNAMHEAEKEVGFHADATWRGPAHNYRNTLGDVTGPKGNPHTATAAQRADALLLVLA